MIAAAGAGAVEQTQRHYPPPRSVGEFCALLDAGRLITTGGKRLVRRTCSGCGGLLLGSVDGAETCWCVLPCPQCRAPVGRRCRRPSGHNVFGDRPHDSRVRATKDDTERRASAGDPDLPARWPTAATSDQLGLW
jgi:hypothetical protein